MSKITVRGWRYRARRLYERKINEFRQYSERCHSSGYVPKLRPWAVKLARPLARIWVYLQVGRVKVVGAENLRLPGRFVFCPNHSALLDAQVAFATVRRKNLRIMAAHDVAMKGLYGIVPVVLGAVGCFSVDRSRGFTVVRPTTNAIVEGSSIVIFPEGKVSHAGECIPLTRGTAMIARRAQMRITDGGRVGIVPIRIDYNCGLNPADFKGYLSYGLKWRAGATVTVSEPMFMDELEDVNDREITARIHDFICNR